MHARLLVCSALLVATACATDDGSIPATDSPQETTNALGNKGPDGGTTCDGRQYWTKKDNRTPQLPADDVELIDTLVPHHQMAVHMAEMELARGADAEVKTMAERVKRDQTKEIEELLAIRKELTGCTAVAPIPDPHMDRDMQMMMEMSGRELDIMFVADMIPHHAGALQFTHYALPNLHEPELIALANNVIDAQAMEVGELHTMLQRLRASTPDGGDAGSTAPDSTPPDGGTSHSH